MEIKGEALTRLQYTCRTLDIHPSLAEFILLMADRHYGQVEVSRLLEQWGCLATVAAQPDAKRQTRGHSSVLAKFDRSSKEPFV